MTTVVPGPGFGRTSLESPTGGGHDGDMSDLEARVEHLEKDVTDIRSTLGRMEPVLNELKGRSQAMPTTWQLIALLLAVMGLMVAGFSFVFSSSSNRLDKMEARIDRIESKMEAGFDKVQGKLELLTDKLSTKN